MYKRQLSHQFDDDADPSVSPDRGSGRFLFSSMGVIVSPRYKCTLWITGSATVNTLPVAYWSERPCPPGSSHPAVSHGALRSEKASVLWASCQSIGRVAGPDAES